MKYMLRVLFSLLLLATTAALAQTDVVESDSTVIDSVQMPAPASMLVAKDKDNDHGHAFVLTWELSPDDGAGLNNVLLYEVFRWTANISDSIGIIDTLFNVAIVDNGPLDQSTATVSEQRIDSLMTAFLGPLSNASAAEKGARLRELRSAYVERLTEVHSAYPANGYWRKIKVVPFGSTSCEDVGGKEPENSGYIPDFTDYYYRVDAVTADTLVRAESNIAGPVQSSGQWFNTGRIPVLCFVIIFTILTLFFVQSAKRGTKLYVRPLGGIEAVDDAIGRATEMGKPILYVLGLGSAADVATIASFTILGRVAKKVAEYQTELIVPTYDPIVMSVAQEVVKSAYYDAGRPDSYNEDTVFFVTQSQFAYVAAVNGIMLRDLPATNIYMGKFYAESLILAETGALAGSIQISGTDEIAQIPFFIVACDYTLIGEELYAASAYLGREPVLLGSLKAQDYAKAAIIILAIIGLVAGNLDWTGFTGLFEVTN